MSEDPKERINRIRAKINQLSKINPNTYLSDRQLDKITQRLEEKRKGIVPISSLDHHKGIFENDTTKRNFSLLKNAKDTGTIVANYFKKIELKKQQSANNQPIKRQKEKSKIDTLQENLKSNQTISIQNSKQNLFVTNQRKNEKSNTSVQKIRQNNKQITHQQKNSTSLNSQIHPISIIQQRQKKPEAIVIDKINKDSLYKAEKINPFLSKQELQFKQQANRNQFIEIDSQTPQVKTNIFKQDFNKNPLKNPFLISQQKKIEISFDKPKIKPGEQSIVVENNQNNKIKRNEQIQPRFQPIKRICSQPAPTSSVTLKSNNTDSIFAKSVNGINLQPARNQQIAQNTKRSNERSENISIRQPKNIFNSKKVPIHKNNGSQKLLSSISESISELPSAQEESALKAPRQKKIPVFEGGSNKLFEKINIPQQQKIHNHQVQFQNFGVKIPSQVKQICQIEDNVIEIPKQQYKQPQKINIFLSTTRKDNDQKSKNNPFKNNSKDKLNEKVDKSNNSYQASITNIFSNPINKPTNIFSQPSPSPSLLSKPNQPQGNIFTKLTTANNIFGNPNIQNISKEDNEEIEDNISESSNQLIQAQDNADPNLSTVKFDYLKPDLIFKQPSTKFRCGSEQKESQENLLISLEKLSNSEDVFLIARMANKLVSFNGKLLKNITKIRLLNGTSRNLEITKILSIMPNKANELTIIKIQFKDLEVGQRFFTQVEKIIN